MKKYISFYRILFVFFATFIITGCVHDDKYNDPDLTNYQCADLVKTKTLQEVINLYKTNIPTGSTAPVTYVFPDTSTDIIEGYVSSTDETGNIYKTIYIQDDPANPTWGFTLSVDAISTYTKFPQGSKIYIKLNGLAVGVYGGLVQLGIKNIAITDPNDNTVARIPEKIIPAHIFRSCTIKEKIVPKVMTLAEMATAKDQYLGCLIQVNDAEFDAKVLCSNYAPDGTSVDRQINDPTASTTTHVVRNSGFASFANQILPSGKGKLIGILSKFNSTYQMYINTVSDLADMTHFPRKDGITTNPCVAPELPAKTVAEVKAMATTAATTQITGDFILKAKVTTSDETGNLYKYLYVEDATGGIKININKTNLYQDARFQPGKVLIVKLKDLYVGAVNGEVQLGVPFNGVIGQVLEADVYKYFFDSNSAATAVVPTEKTITQLTKGDVGRWIKIKDLQFIDSDLGNSYSGNRTLTDCSGHTLTLRTSQANFASQTIDSGKGDVYGVLSIFNGTYQLMITDLRGAVLSNPRCDGTLPQVTKIFNEDFGNSNLANWIPVSVTGAQVWGITTFGNPKPAAIMDGNRLANEDWLISKPIAIPTGFSDVSLSFDTDGRFTGNPLEVYVTDNYTGVATTTWTKLNPTLDPDTVAFAGFISSGRMSLKNYIGKNVVVAFKYTSVVGASTTWEVDNIAVSGIK